VILRVIRGRAERAQLEALRRALGRKLRSNAPESAGLTRFHLGTRPGGDRVEVVIISFWISAEAAAGGGAARHVTVARRAGVEDVEVALFEIDETILRSSVEEPIAIRVATGRFSRHGADIEMQELLRQRVPLIGTEMTEAFVGRRIVDRAVDVAFVSAWRRVPEDRRLEDTFWPDIALRYDHFAVEVYEAVGIDGDIRLE
jgi:hypothetical protein